MNTKGIRLEIKPWLYKILTERQESIKNQTGRKTSLADILLDYCMKGLKMYKTEKILPKTVQNEGQTVQNGADSVQNQGQTVQNGYKKAKKRGNSVQNESKTVQNKGETVQNSVQNEPHTVQNQYLENQLRILDYKEKLLNNREKQLYEREKLLLRRENVQNNKTVQFFAQKEELLKEKEESLETIIDNAFNERTLGQLNDDLEDKNQTIRTLEEKLEKQQEKIDRLLTTFSEQDKKKKSSVIEQIVPWIAPVLSIVGYFMLNKKINDLKEIEPVQKRIEGLLKGLSMEDKKMLMDHLNKFSKDSS